LAARLSHFDELNGINLLDSFEVGFGDSVHPIQDFPRR